jgi:hypothetical protein
VTLPCQHVTWHGESNHRDIKAIRDSLGVIDDVGMLETVDTPDRLAMLGEIIDSYLSGNLSGSDAARTTKDDHWEYQDRLPREQGSLMERLFIRAFLALRRRSRSENSNGTRRELTPPSK